MGTDTASMPSSVDDIARVDDLRDRLSTSDLRLLEAPKAASKDLMYIGGLSAAQWRAICALFPHAAHELHGDMRRGTGWPGQRPSSSSRWASSSASALRSCATPPIA